MSKLVYNYVSTSIAGLHSSTLAHMDDIHMYPKTLGIMKSTPLTNIRYTFHQLLKDNTLTLSLFVCPPQFFFLQLKYKHDFTCTTMVKIVAKDCITSNVSHLIWFFFFPFGYSCFSITDRWFECLFYIHTLEQISAHLASLQYCNSVW